MGARPREWIGGESDGGDGSGTAVARPGAAAGAAGESGPPEAPPPALRETLRALRDAWCARVGHPDAAAYTACTIDLAAGEPRAIVFARSARDGVAAWDGWEHLAPDRVVVPWRAWTDLDAAADAAIAARAAAAAAAQADADARFGHDLAEFRRSRAAVAAAVARREAMTPEQRLVAAYDPRDSGAPPPGWGPPVRRAEWATSTAGDGPARA